MAQYRPLFITGGSGLRARWVAVDPETGGFRHALYELGTRGAGYVLDMIDRGEPLSIAQVRALARKSTHDKAARYRDITEANWREIVNGRGDDA